LREIKVRRPTSSATAWEARSASPSRSGTPTSCGLKASQGRPLGRARSEDERPQLDTAAVAEMGTAHRQFQGLGTVAGPQHEEAQWLFGPLGRHRLLQDVHLACEFSVARQLAPRGECPRPGGILVAALLVAVLRLAVEQEQELGPGVPRV